jgi:hypothetical protein
MMPAPPVITATLFLRFSSFICSDLYYFFFYLSLNPSPRREGLKYLYIIFLPPSLLGEGGRGKRHFIF